MFTTGEGPEVLTLTGGATGLYCGYVDFIAWDIRTVLKMAKEFFEDSDIPWANFHTFRREAGSVPLKQQDDEPETENQDDELEETLDILYQVSLRFGNLFWRPGQRSLSILLTFARCV